MRSLRQITIRWWGPIYGVDRRSLWRTEQGKKNSVSKSPQKRALPWAVHLLRLNFRNTGAHGDEVGFSNRSQSASSRVSCITHGLGREIGWMSPKIEKIALRRFRRNGSAASLLRRVRGVGRNSRPIRIDSDLTSKVVLEHVQRSLTRGNVAPIFANRTSPTETGLAG
jgi:hypothetical protein